MKRVLQSLYSLSGKMSYCKIQWSFEAAWFGFRTYPIAQKFDRHLNSGAAEMIVKFQNDMTIITSNPAASRLNDILAVGCLSE